MCRRGGKKGAADQALGRSRGGFGTKVHASISPLGHPVELVRTGGQAADVKPADIPAGKSRGPEKFFDGHVFDPAHPETYLAGLAIKKLSAA